jgi:hypothetical protein
MKNLGALLPAIILLIILVLVLTVLVSGMVDEPASPESNASTTRPSIIKPVLKPDYEEETTTTESDTYEPEESETTIPDTEVETTEPEEPTVTEPAVDPEPEVTGFKYRSDIPLAEDVQLEIYNLCHEDSQCFDWGLTPELVYAMIYTESRYKADAVGDSGNSLGLMQIQPRWHQKRMEKLGVTDLKDPIQNVRVGIDLLKELLYRYDGSVEKTLVTYNQGHYKGTVTSYAKKVLAKATELAEIE